jgi:hypothetical protein
MPFSSRCAVPSGVSREGAKNARSVLRVLRVFAALSCLAACPRLPPPAPRALAQVISIERTGPSTLRARLAVSREGHAATVAAIDWELSRPGGPPLVRGRAASLDVVIALPPQSAALSRVRLRGAIHLREGRAAATFDHTALLR